MHRRLSYAVPPPKQVKGAINYVLSGFDHTGCSFHIHAARQCRRGYSYSATKAVKFIQAQDRAQTVPTQ